MNSLTSRDRLTRLFAGQDIDRVPIWLLFPWHPLGCYADVWNIPAYAPILDRIANGDADSFDRRSVNTGFCYNANPEIRVARSDTEAGGIRRSETRVTAPGLSLTRYVQRDAERTQVQYYVDDPNRLRDILRVPYVPPCPDFETLATERRAFGDAGLFMLDLGDPLAPLYHLMSATDFSMATATDYELLLEFLDVMEGRVLDLYRACLEADAADCYFIVGCEFAGPPLVSPARFEEMSVRYVKRICDMIRDFGKISIVHYHGNLARILGGMAAIGMDGLHTVEAPPIGDCTLTMARSALPRTVLIGNIQYDDITRLPAEAIEAQVRGVLEEAKDGPFILSPTAGPYETDLPPRAVENYLRLIEAGLRYGKR